MRRLLAGFALLLAVSAVRADDKPKGPLAEARQRWLKGNLAEARDLFAEKAKDEKLAAPAAIGIARAWLSEGEYDKARATLEAALKKHESNADLLGWRAEISYQTGKWDEALRDVEAALKENKDHFVARWVRARIFRDKGDTTSADTEMRWFVRTYTRRSNMDDDIKDPDELIIVGQAGTENARWHNLSDQFRFILNEVYVDVVKFEPDCWIAEYLAGSMLLEKYNRPQAVKAFDKALAMNPRAAEAFVGKGLAALQGLEIKDAEQYAEEALKLNPRLTSALRLRADVHILTGSFGEAFKVLEKAKSINPREEPTLARLAACQHFTSQKEAFDKTVAAVKEFNPKPGVFYYDLASTLEDRKFYYDAEKFFKQAIELNDKMAGPKSGLGMLYLRLGKETEARELLDKSFKADPFNVRVANSRKVLTHLDSYARKESKHYILRYDAKTDAILAEFLLDFLEEVHAHLLKEYGYEPEGKILIELFNNHEMFSGRTVALPDLHTIGACTGRVVTMVSPRGKGVPKLFNWGRVIRHELVHIFNLAQTDFQVPHWLTEGLAVRNEGTGRPPSWNVILRDRFNKNDLLTLDTIQLGFVRPRSQDEWTLAYCQSLLYVEYMIDKFGLGSIGKMLDAYREGLSNAASIEKVCKVDKPAFEKGYKDYVAAIVKAIPGTARKTDKPMTLTELEKALETNPNDVDLAARLAQEYQQRKKNEEAGKLADKVLEKDKTHAIANIVKARLLKADGDDVAARKLIEGAVTAKGDDSRLRAFLARLCLESKEFAAAAEQFEHCRRLAPLDGDWLEFLEEIYTKLDDKEKLISVLKEKIANNADDIKARIKLAEMLLDAKKPAEAEPFALEAVQIDVLSMEARKLLLQALKEQKKDAEAEKIEKRYEAVKSNE